MLRTQKEAFDGDFFWGKSNRRDVFAQSGYNEKPSSFYVNEI